METCILGRMAQVRQTEKDIRRKGKKDAEGAEGKGIMRDWAEKRRTRVDNRNS